MEPADLTSWHMILGAASGREQDRDALSRRYGPVIRAYLAARWRLPMDHDAVSDATSEVFVECFKDRGALSRVDPASSGGFRAFLFGVVRNVALMAERRLARRRDLPAFAEMDMDQIARSEATLSRVFDRAWAQAVVQDARELMGGRSQRSEAAARRFRALTLRFEGEMPPRDVAREMGLAVEQVYELLKEARREFRSTLLEVMAAYHPACPEQELEQRCVDLLASLK